jgi:hypothetical protein
MTVSVFAPNTANALRSPRLARVLDGLLALPSTFRTFCFESAVISTTYEALGGVKIRATSGER